MKRKAMQMAFSLRKGEKAKASTGFTMPSPVPQAAPPTPSANPDSDACMRSPALRTHSPHNKPSPVVPTLRAKIQPSAAAGERVQMPSSSSQEQQRTNGGPKGQHGLPTRARVEPLRSPSEIHRGGIKPDSASRRPRQCCGLVHHRQTPESDGHSEPIVQYAADLVPPTCDPHRQQQHGDHRASPFHCLPDSRVRLHVGSLPHSGHTAPAASPVRS